MYREVGFNTYLSTAFVLIKEYKKLFDVEKIPGELRNIFPGRGYYLDNVPYVDFIEHFGISNSREALKFVLNPNNEKTIDEYVEWYEKDGRKNRQR